jgi:hypothetical protein
MLTKRQARRFTTCAWMGRASQHKPMWAFAPLRPRALAPRADGGGDRAEKRQPELTFCGLAANYRLPRKWRWHRAEVKTRVITAQSPLRRRRPVAKAHWHVRCNLWET